jgi:hypothetical protein
MIGKHRKSNIAKAAVAKEMLKFAATVGMH